MMRRLFAMVSLFVAVGRAETERGLVIRSAVEGLKRGANVAIAGQSICAAHPLPLFYARRDFRPAWTAADEQGLLAAIDGARDDGLSPADYHLAAIEALRRDPSRAEELDLLLTDAFFLLASHLLSGRIDPLTIEPTWCLEPRTADLVPALETALETHDLAATLDGLRSTHAGYWQLRDALARYRKMQPWQPLDRMPTVTQLAERLSVAPEQVTEAVKHFQRLHGLDEDGVVGPRTLRELNVPLAVRVRQLELNLERWRWLPANLGARRAMINIPQFQLSVIEQERPVLTMRIVVGKDFDHRTPVFSADIRQVVFSPYWNVPDSIAGRELWPKQRRDPSFFAREHIEVLDNGRLRQKPGPWNALGLIKFDIPNRYVVYLHDTPARELFARSTRAFSHGCMRIEKPVDLAVYLLGWPAERVVSESQTGAEHAVAVPVPLTVHVLYWTAFVEDGEAHFAPDVYARDRSSTAPCAGSPAVFND